jgi:predicted esterase
LSSARAAVILVHGRGAGAEDILTLAPAIAVPGVAVAAPAAAQHTWYPYSFLSPIERNEPGITSGIAVLHALIDEAAAAGVPAERVVLLGFSQGACLAATAAQRRPARYGGVVAFSGGLIGPPGTPWPEDGDFRSTPVFFGCSDRDPHIPESRVRESAELLERMGAAVTVRIYPGMGHLVNEDEIAFARALILSLAA